MRKLPDYIKSIHLDCEGEVTRTRWVGDFKIKVVLTHADQLKIERLYKQFLPDDVGIKQDKKLKAIMLAELYVRVIDSPLWWEGTKYGQMLVDDQPLYDLMIGYHDGFLRWQEEVNKMADPETNIITDEPKKNETTP